MPLERNSTSRQDELCKARPPRIESTVCRATAPESDVWMRPDRRGAARALDEAQTPDVDTSSTADGEILRSTTTPWRRVPSIPEPSVIRILGIPGSLRRHSYNRAVIEAAAAVAPGWIQVEVFGKLGDVPLFDADVADVTVPPGVQTLRTALRESDAVLISTPEYNQAVPGVVKNMIDWLSMGTPEEGLAGRPIAITGVTTGPWGTRIAQTMLRQMLVSTQALVLPRPSLYLHNAPSLFDDTGEFSDAEARERLAELVTALGDWAKTNGAPGVPAAVSPVDQSVG